MHAHGGRALSRWCGQRLVTARGVFGLQPGASGEQTEGASGGDDGGRAVLQHGVRQGAAEGRVQHGPEDPDRPAVFRWDPAVWRWCEPPVLDVVFPLVWVARRCHDSQRVSEDHLPADRRSGEARGRVGPVGGSGHPVGHAGTVRTYVSGPVVTLLVSPQGGSDLVDTSRSGHTVISLTRSAELAFSS